MGALQKRPAHVRGTSAPFMLFQVFLLSFLIFCQPLCYGQTVVSDDAPADKAHSGVAAASPNLDALTFTSSGDATSGELSWSLGGSLVTGSVTSANYQIYDGFWAFVTIEPITRISDWLLYGFGEAGHYADWFMCAWKRTLERNT